MKRWKADPKEKYNGKTIRQWWAVLRSPRPVVWTPVTPIPPPLSPAPRVAETSNNREQWLCFYCDRPFSEHPDNTKCPDTRLQKWLSGQAE